MKTKLTFILLFWIGGFFLGQAQDIVYANELNQQMVFKGVLPVLEVQENYHNYLAKFEKKHRSWKQATIRKNATLIYHFDAKQRLSDRIYYENKRLRIKDTILYDEHSGLKQRTISDYWNPSSRLRFIKNYIYDAEGTLVAIRTSDGGNLLSETRFKNSAQGLPVEASFYDPESNSIRIIEEAEYLLEQNRYVIKRLETLRGTPSLDTFILDPQQRAAYPAKGETFNERGDLVRAELKYQSLFYQYLYDEQGNWIEKKCFQLAGDIYKEKGFLLEKRTRKYHYAPKP